MSLGQSAIEYVTTYGWMLVAVSVAAGTTYSFVDFSCARSTSGFYSESISVENFGVTTNDTLVISVKNEDYTNLEITGLNLSREDSYRYRNISTRVDPGKSSIVGLPGYELSEGCYKYEATLVYNRGPLEDQKLRGTIRAPIGPGPLPVPDAPANLTVKVTA